MSVAQAHVSSRMLYLCTCDDVYLCMQSATLLMQQGHRQSFEMLAAAENLRAQV